ncbi:MAG: CinA family protein [Microbacteriaceae bacterium]|nr:CinA family protein [Microbacteriaceae bacterium]
MPDATVALSEARFEQIAAAGWRIAVAESLTGGLLADAFVSVPGASSVFSGAVVAYDTALKHSVLGVDEALLIESGPVHPEVARHMARGVRAVCAVRREQGGEAMVADIGLATTGVAGPDPDPQTGQAAGTVWLGVSSRLGDRAVLMQFDGDRQAIREAAVRAVLIELADELSSLGLDFPET